VWSTSACVNRNCGDLVFFTYFFGCQVGLQLLNLTSLINKQELMLRVMGVDAKESDPGRFTMLGALPVLDEFVFAN
jgi:hypothetical protein